MTEEEYENLKEGDYVDLTCRVIKMNEAKRFPTLIVGDQLIALTSPMLRAWGSLPERYTPRRKFKRNDLVKRGDERFVLEEDEGADGRVEIAEDVYFESDEMTLLLPAEEVEKLTEWKGGAK